MAPLEAPNRDPQNLKPASDQLRTGIGGNFGPPIQPDPTERITVTRVRSKTHGLMHIARSTMH